MTLDEWFDAYLAPEYLNVQSPSDFRAMAKAELLKAVNAPAPAAPTPSPAAPKA